MENEAIVKFEKLFDCHKDALIEAAHANNDEIWINMCALYDIRGGDAARLKNYLHSLPSPVRRASA